MWRHWIYICELPLRAIVLRKKKREISRSFGEEETRMWQIIDGGFFSLFLHSFDFLIYMAYIAFLKSNFYNFINDQISWIFAQREYFIFFYYCKHFFPQLDSLYDCKIASVIFPDTRYGLFFSRNESTVIYSEAQSDKLIFIILHLLLTVTAPTELTPRA